MKKIAFLCGAPRSGTSLLMNLLDGHPNVFTHPIDTTVLINWNYHKTRNSEERFFLRDYLNTEDVLFFTNKTARKEHTEYMKNFYGAEDYFKFDPISEDLFIERYLEFLKSHGVSLGTVYSALFRAVLSPEVFDKEDKWIIEGRPFENEMGAIQLNKVFPEARFIHIIRDPRTRYISSKTRGVRRILGVTPKWATNQNGKDFATAHSEISMITLELARLNKKVLGDIYHVVLYEDLIRDPEKEMRRIAEHLGIDFDEILLKQTLNKKLQMGASSIDKGLPSGVKNTNQDRLDLFYRDVSSLEKKIMSFLTWEVARYFNYDIDPVHRLSFRDCLKPMKYEIPTNYLKNRIWMMRNLRGYSAIIKVRLFHAVLHKFYRGEMTSI